MSSVSDPTPTESPAAAEEGVVTRFFRATELDTRMLGMVAALAVIWIGFDIYSGILRANEGLFGGSFLTPRNLWTLLVQTSSIAIMSTGMVLLIVMRQLDLSVGSMLSTIAVATGVLQVFELGPWLGVGHESIWIIAVLFALALGLFIGWFNGMLTAYAGIPAFIVTLGGLIAYSGIAWALIRGETVAPMDKTFKLLGGNGPLASIGPFWSWLIAAVACVVVVLAILNGRRQRGRVNFPQRPIWAEVFLATCGGVAILGLTWIVNSYPWAPRVAEAYAKANGIAIPPASEYVPSGDAICMQDDKAIGCEDGLIFYKGYAMLGPTWSWVIAAVACAAIVALVVVVGRRRRQNRGELSQGPTPAEAILALLGCAAVVALTAFVTSRPWAPADIEAYAKANDIKIPLYAPPSWDNICMAGDKVVACAEGLVFYTGYAIPVLIAMAVGVLMTFIAGRTAFGRYVYAAGGNPEAAELSGINTRRLTVMVFMLMGLLVAVSAIITSARLDAATNSLGQLNELYVIAAVVIGGTSLAGGVGTIYGAMLGALLMQSLQSGMTLLNFESAYKDMVVGGVLVTAVFVDQIYRRRVK